MDGFLSSSDVPALDFILEIINPLFFNYYFGRKNFYNKLEVYASGTGSKRIHEKIFLGLNVKFPIKEEQTKIANFLSSLDTKISQNKKNLEETQKFKKALLQKMFV
jgi:type I restriction enzyme S subunit